MKLAVAALLFAATTALAQPKQRACEAETAPLMSEKSSWDEMQRAALALPARCFDGYFAEGISEALTRKMRKDWPGFFAVLARQPQEDAFFRLALRSINATLDPADIRALQTLAQKSCPSEHRSGCEAIAREAAKALEEAK